MEALNEPDADATGVSNTSSNSQVASEAVAGSLKTTLPELSKLAAFVPVLVSSRVMYFPLNDPVDILRNDTAVGSESQLTTAKLPSEFGKLPPYTSHSLFNSTPSVPGEN